MALLRHIQDIRKVHGLIINSLTLLPLIVCSFCSIVIGPSHIDFNNLLLGKHPVLFYVLGTVISFDIIICFSMIRFQSKIMQFFGRNSLFIMCTHLPLLVVDAVNKMLDKTDSWGWFESDVIIPISFLALLIIESLMIVMWQKIKPFLAKYRVTSFAKYM